MHDLNGSLSFAAEKRVSNVAGMALTGRAATSRDLSQELGAFHQDGHNRVRWHRGEFTLAACNCHRRTGQSTGMMPWTARSPHLPPIESFWSLVEERLARHHTPITAVDELWYRADAAWTYVPAKAI
ncbi:hypothetical protein TNCV_2909711 [Trichonephila clavipes]|nr:hypothetical protein TNCV_2909711 [Trichonephila clavipes]